MSAYLTSNSYQARAPRTSSLSLTPTRSLTNMVFHPKSRTTKRTKEASNPITGASPSRHHDVPIAGPATPSSRATTPTGSPPSKAKKPIISIPTPTPTPTTTRPKADGNPLSPPPTPTSSSVSKRARLRQVKLDKAACAASSRTDVEMNLLKVTGLMETVDDSGSTQDSPESPQLEADRRSPSPTLPQSCPTERSLGEKPKRRFEPVDLHNEAADRKNFLKTMYQAQEPSKTVDDARENAVGKSPKYSKHEAQRRSLSPSKQRHQAERPMSKRSKKH